MSQEPLSVAQAMRAVLRSRWLSRGRMAEFAVGSTELVSIAAACGAEAMVIQEWKGRSGPNILRVVRRQGKA